ncbi:aminotransferase class V-fold PLP-dependent enzyme [Rhodopirellula sp. SWK7]|uniref:aminotransferase class V-fold PLP-dependent enzyme n=1 Tax=Rhodopirellula sp. SWK7 TaxID=595460 RepID=UPI0002BF6B6A|nr:SufS family cysteine desulfurase [Rhodopirellula sp. SWK7]EMI44274.1 cysteine desulfurase, SufS subfamily [Rhodopirellula sp. SWK7]
MSLLDTDKIRRDFPVLQRNVTGGHPLIYLDNAASTQRPRAVIEAMDECYLQYYSNVHRGIHTLSEESTRAYEAARETTREFLNAASAREIIFAAGTTAAINTVARSWGDANVSSGDVILLLISEHHANIVPWHQLAARTGCRVEFIPIDENFEISDETVAEYLDRLQPKMFAFAAASNTLGSEYPVQRWTSMARQHGATVLIDAAQAAPHQQIDVQAWDADFVVFSGHKVCGPTGIGVLYGKEAMLDAMPAFLGGGGMILNVTTEGFTTHELPEKFEAGTPPIVEAIGLAAALKYLTAIGMENIHAHERVLGERADAGLRAIDGVRVIGPTADKKGGINSFVIEGVHAHDVSQFLDGRGVAVRAGHHCTMPLHQSLGVTATARASCYLYNTPDEVDHLLAAVADVRAKFARSGRRRRTRRPVEPSA